MYIHIGNKQIVSGKSIIGIFNKKSILKSSINNEISIRIRKTQCDIKTIIIDSNNRLLTSKIGSHTIIKRNMLNSHECVWRKK